MLGFVQKAGPTGAQAWSQTAGFAAVGAQIELLPIIAAPVIAASFSPATILTGGTSTLTFNLNNPNAVPLTNAGFTDMLANMSVASTTISGSCAGVTNNPALSVGATALNMTIPSVPVGGCSITVQVTSTTAGSNPNTTSGVTTTQTPTAGAVSNTANLTVVTSASPPTITHVFTPAWIGQGGPSTLTFSLSSPTAIQLTNANFSDTLNNMSVAATAIGGTCTGVTNSPALTVGAIALNLTIPTLPATGCTVTLQVTSAVLGSQSNLTSGVTSVETPTAGAVSNTVYLTVSPADVGFSYVHADHLGTPRAITRPSDNQVVWKWENSDPFGANAPNEDPANTGVAFKYNLRFPGQYYDQETGTHYNYFRDYDPATGRHIQSDPMGLWGGLATYDYVASGPLSGVDPRGLIKHTTGQTTECSKNCTIRIDHVLDEKTGQVKRHLHWDCRGDSGAAGEHGGNSHGGNCDQMPNRVKECAKAAGFNCDPLPAPPSERRTCEGDCQRAASVVTVLGMMFLSYRVLCGGPF